MQKYNDPVWWNHFQDNLIKIRLGEECYLEEILLAAFLTNAYLTIESKSIKIYKNWNAALSTTICQKLNVCGNLLHYDSAHPKSLKDSVVFSKALRIKQISSETSEVMRHFKDLKDTFI